MTSAGTEDQLAPDPPPPDVRWGLGDAAAGWLLGSLAAIALGGLAAAAGAAELLALALGQIGLWLGLLGSVLWAGRRKGTGRVGGDFGFRWRPLDLVIGPVIGLGSQLLLVPLIYLPLRWFIENPDVSKPARELAEQARGPAYIGFAAVAILAAPVIEELFFRGLVLRSILRRFGTGWAVTGSAAAFGVAHLQLLQLPALVALGLVLGLMAVRTGRLGPGIAAHAAFNALAVVSLYVRR